MLSKSKVTVTVRIWRFTQGEEIYNGIVHLQYCSALPMHDRQAWPSTNSVIWQTTREDHKRLPVQNTNKYCTVSFKSFPLYYQHNNEWKVELNVFSFNNSRTQAAWTPQVCLFACNLEIVQNNCLFYAVTVCLLQSVNELQIHFKISYFIAGYAQTCMHSFKHI